MNVKEPPPQTLTGRTPIDVYSRHVFAGGIILTPDHPPMRNAAIVVDQGKILAIGPTDSILERFPAVPITNTDDYVLVPGLFNAHTHAAMSFFRGLCHNTKNMIEDLFFPVESQLTPDLIEPLSYSYLICGLRSGVTCFADHYYFVDGVGRALKRLGLRGVIGETTADLGSAFPSLKTWNRARQQIENWPFDNDMIRPAIAPHAIDTVSAKLLNETAKFAKANNLPLHLHLSQTTGERDRVHKRHGMSPVQVAARAEILTDRTLAVHLVSADAEDLKLLAASGTTAGLCPASQIIYEKLAPIKQFADLKIKVALGTDCAASNDSADLLSELKLTALLYKEHLLDESTRRPEALLKLVTVNPAQTFGFDRIIGSLEPGKAADIVFLKRDITSEPMHDPFANLIFSLSSRHVRHVMVNGTWVLWNQMPTLVDEHDLMHEYSAAIQVIEKVLFKKAGINL